MRGVLRERLHLRRWLAERAERAGDSDPRAAAPHRDAGRAAAAGLISSGWSRLKAITCDSLAAGFAPPGSSRAGGRLLSHSHSIIFRETEGSMHGKLPWATEGLKKTTSPCSTSTVTLPSSSMRPAPSALA